MKPPTPKLKPQSANPKTPRRAGLQARVSEFPVETSGFRALGLRVSGVLGELGAWGGVGFLKPSTCLWAGAENLQIPGEMDLVQRP